MTHFLVLLGMLGCGVAFYAVVRVLSARSVRPSIRRLCASLGDPHTDWTPIPVGGWSMGGVRVIRLSYGYDVRVGTATIELNDEERELAGQAFRRRQGIVTEKALAEADARDLERLLSS